MLNPLPPPAGPELFISLDVFVFLQEVLVLISYLIAGASCQATAPRRRWVQDRLGFWNRSKRLW